MYILVAKDAKFLHVDTCNETLDQTANACWLHISEYNVFSRWGSYTQSSSIAVCFDKFLYFDDSVRGCIYVIFFRSFLQQLYDRDV